MILNLGRCLIFACALLTFALGLRSQNWSMVSNGIILFAFVFTELGFYKARKTFVKLSDTLRGVYETRIARLELELEETKMKVMYDKAKSAEDRCEAV